MIIPSRFITLLTTSFKRSSSLHPSFPLGLLSRLIPLCLLSYQRILWFDSSFRNGSLSVYNTFTWKSETWKMTAISDFTFSADSEYLYLCCEVNQQSILYSIQVSHFLNEMCRMFAPVFNRYVHESVHYTIECTGEWIRKSHTLNCRPAGISIGVLSWELQCVVCVFNPA